MSRCPKTAAEAWKRLDKRLTEEEKKQIVDSEDLLEFHFGLGMWIRNYWIYSGEEENLKSLMKDLGEVSIHDGDIGLIFIPRGDRASSVILEAYQNYLRTKMPK